MPSQLQAQDVELIGIPMMNRNTSRQSSSIQCNASRLSNAKKPFIEETRSSTAQKINRQKPWPSRKVNEDEEVIKYMTTVPNYLQQLETKVDVKDKALNVGVLDWRSLEKWTYLKKQAANKRGSDSPSSTNASSSSPFSTFGSSSISDGSIDIPLANKMDKPLHIKASTGFKYEVMKDRPEDRTNGRCISYDSALNNRTFPRNSEVQSTNAPPQISYSCPLASNQSDEEQLKVKVAPRRESSPQRLLRAGLNRIRGSSFSEGSSEQHIKQTICCDNNRKGRRSPSPQRILTAGLNLLRNSSSNSSHEGNAASNRKSRHSRSPLRRIFDPLSSKTRIHFSGPVTSLHNHRAQATGNEGRLLIRDESKAATGSSHAIDAECTLQTEKEVNPTRQALMKLSWKNGHPLFVFSSSDINILAATMRKRKMTQNEDFEYTYTIFTAHEQKKKGGTWTSQMNRSKKHDLAYNVVGQLRASSSKNLSLVREFVLFGSEQISTTQDCASCLLKPELAAIVVHLQYERPENCNCNSSVESPSLASIITILPSGVHGISSTGEPTPLIERWKSGGSCDCGGWDEGCMLTVLTDTNPASKSSSSEQAHITDGSRRIELFTQGAAKGNKHAFSMITFKEGVYTVDFGTSISTVQAFAMCLAILHYTKVPTLSDSCHSLESDIPEELLISSDTSMRSTYSQDDSLTSYLPEHPPLSPFRRA